MIVSIHQPDYIPYIGYFYKISQSDMFVYLDDVQYSNENRHQWNRIKSPNGECRLKIPVKQHLGDLINHVQTRDELGWKHKHLYTIEMNYARAVHYKEIYSAFSNLLLREYKSLANMNIAINNWICNGFGFKKPMLLSSDMCIETHSEERVLDICSRLGANMYISGNGARIYQTEENFIRRGIILCYSNFKPFEYKQCWKSFLPNMSIIDYLMNCGFDWERVSEGIQVVNRSY